MFASATVDYIEFGDETVTIKKLSHGELTLAAEEKMTKALMKTKDVGPELMRALRDPGSVLKSEAEPTPAEKRKARYESFDIDFVLRHGIKSWTCTVAGEPLDVAVGIPDLDEPTARRLHEAIVDLSCGPLDADEAEQLAAKG